MKRWARLKVMGWITGAVVLALAGALAWFWSLGALPSEGESTITLRVDRAPVEVWKKGTTNYGEAVDGMTLVPGDAVKTGAGGQATVIFFEEAETRMDAGSEVVIQEAEHAGDASVKIRVDLAAGRVWSRVLRLFDLDSAFAVKTSSVVATVRGTAFDVRANADKTTEVWVSDSAVTVEDPSTVVESATPGVTIETTATISINGVPVGSSARRAVSFNPLEEGASVSSTMPVVTSADVGTGVPAGHSAVFAADGRLVRQAAITAELRGEKWFTQNAAADELFLRSARDGKKDVLKRLGGTDPDTLWEGLSRVSEGLHLRLAGARRGELAERYLARRFARIINAADSGRTGQAAQALSRLENDLRSRWSGEKEGEERRVVRGAIRRVLLLAAGASPTSPLYPLKQRFEDLALQAEQAPAAQLFARLRIVDDRLDEASRLLDDRMWEDARTALDAAKGGIENARREGTSMMQSIEPKHRHTLVAKLLAVVVREAAERARLLAGAVTPSVDVTATSTTSGTADPNAPVVPVDQTPAFVGINLFVQPNPLDLGQAATVSVFATDAAGVVTNVTSKANFRVVQGAASVKGAQLTATGAGSAVIVEAWINDAGVIRNARASVNVVSTATLQDLKIGLASASITSGSRVTLSPTAVFSNGYSKSVTVTWKNATPALGTLSGNVFTAAAGATGVAEIQGTYTEGGLTETATVYITIVAPNPNAPRTR